MEESAQAPDADGDAGDTSLCEPVILSIREICLRRVAKFSVQRIRVDVPRQHGDYLHAALKKGRDLPDESMDIEVLFATRSAIAERLDRQDRRLRDWVDAQVQLRELVLWRDRERDARDGKSDEGHWDGEVWKGGQQ